MNDHIRVLVLDHLQHIRRGCGHALVADERYSKVLGHSRRVIEGAVEEVRSLMWFHAAEHVGAVELPRGETTDGGGQRAIISVSYCMSHMRYTLGADCI